MELATPSTPGLKALVSSPADMVGLGAQTGEHNEQCLHMPTLIAALPAPDVAGRWKASEAAEGPIAGLMEGSNSSAGSSSCAAASVLEGEPSSGPASGQVHGDLADISSFAAMINMAFGVSDTAPGAERSPAADGGITNGGSAWAALPCASSSGRATQQPVLVPAPDVAAAQGTVFDAECAVAALGFSRCRVRSTHLSFRPGTPDAWAEPPGGGDVCGSGGDCEADDAAGHLASTPRAPPLREGVCPARSLQLPEAASMPDLSFASRSLSLGGGGAGHSGGQRPSRLGSGGLRGSKVAAAVLYFSGPAWSGGGAGARDEPGTPHDDSDPGSPRQQALPRGPSNKLAAPMWAAGLPLGAPEEHTEPDDGASQRGSEAAAPGSSRAGRARRAMAYSHSTPAPLPLPPSAPGTPALAQPHPLLGSPAGSGLLSAGRASQDVPGTEGEPGARSELGGEGAALPARRALASQLSVGSGVSPRHSHVPAASCSDPVAVGVTSPELAEVVAEAAAGVDVDVGDRGEAATAAAPLATDMAAPAAGLDAGVAAIAAGPAAGQTAECTPEAAAEVAKAEAEAEAGREAAEQAAQAGAGACATASAAAEAALREAEATEATEAGAEAEVGAEAREVVSAEAAQLEAETGAAWPTDTAAAEVVGAEAEAVPEACSAAAANTHVARNAPAGAAAAAEAGPDAAACGAMAEAFPEGSTEVGVLVAAEAEAAEADAAADHAAGAAAATEALAALETGGPEEEEEGEEVPGAVTNTGRAAGAAAEVAVAVKPREAAQARPQSAAAATAKARCLPSVREAPAPQRHASAPRARACDAGQPRAGSAPRRAPAAGSAPVRAPAASRASAERAPAPTTTPSAPVRAARAAAAAPSAAPAAPHRGAAAKQPATVAAGAKAKAAGAGPSAAPLQQAPVLTVKARASATTPAIVAAAADASLQLSRRRHEREAAAAASGAGGLPSYLRPTAAFAAKSSPSSSSPSSPSSAAPRVRRPQLYVSLA